MVPLEVREARSDGDQVSQFALGGWRLPGWGVRDESGVETMDKEEMAKTKGVSLPQLALARLLHRQEELGLP